MIHFAVQRESAAVPNHDLSRSENNLQHWWVNVLFFPSMYCIELQSYCSHHVTHNVTRDGRPVGSSEDGVQMTGVAAPGKRPDEGAVKTKMKIVIFEMLTLSDPWPLPYFEMFVKCAVLKMK